MHVILDNMRHMYNVVMLCLYSWFLLEQHPEKCHTSSLVLTLITTIWKQCIFWNTKKRQRKTEAVLTQLKTQQLRIIMDNKLALI